MPCAACGAENPAGTRSCLTCGSALAASASVAAVVSSPRVARLGDRLLAVILDTVLLATTLASVAMWAAARRGGMPLRAFDITSLPALLTIGGATLVGFLYYWLFEALFGATIGKTIVGVTVRGVTGGGCGAKRSLIRNLLRLVDGLLLYFVGFLFALVSRKRQRLGDLLAGTVVVESEVGRVWRSLLVLFWLGGITAALLGGFLIYRAAPRGGTPTTPAPTATASAAPNASGATAAAPATTAPLILASGDLRLADFAFLQSEAGAARPSGSFKPQERVFAVCKATGLSTDPDGQVHLRYSVEASDPNGIPIQKLMKQFDGPPGAANTAAISFWFDLPLYVPSGNGKVRVTAHDSVKNSDGDVVALLIVEAPATAPPERLELRDLHLSSSDGGPILDPAVFSAGNTVYAQGKLAGVQFRADQIDVAIALQVSDPAGITIVDKPEFLEIKDSFSYHPPTFYVPITARLSLPQGATKGTYRERYVVTDRMAGTARTYELTFKLE
jgi:uncharacterized RDD family membrane protein YckC